MLYEKMKAETGRDCCLLCNAKPPPVQNQRLKVIQEHMYPILIPPSSQWVGAIHFICFGIQEAQRYDMECETTVENLEYANYRH